MTQTGKIKKLEELVNKIENETDFDKAAEDFDTAAKLVKELQDEFQTKQGKLYEVIARIETESDYANPY
jgi:exonuclease VII small subunit